jgi:hypothetical protein
MTRSRPWRLAAARSIRCRRYATAQGRWERHAAEPLAARSFHQFLGHDRAADVVGDGDRQAQGRVWQRDDEFLAAVTGCDVMTPFCFIETARDPAPDRPVARTVEANGGLHLHLCNTA